MSKLKKQLSSWYLIIPVALVALTGGAIWYINRQAEPTDKPATVMPAKNKAIGNDSATHEATSEGDTFPVPNNVPEGSVKNYHLITENEHFKIRELNGAYTITLYAIINGPDDAASYRQQLHDYKQAALQYLSEHGVDVSKVSITYDPPEAANY